MKIRAHGHPSKAQSPAVRRCAPPLAEPGRAAVEEESAAPAPVTEQLVIAARQRSADIVRDLAARSRLPLASVEPWPRGGLNE